MKMFLIKFFYLILPIIVVSVTFEVFLREIPNDYKYKSDYLKKNAKDIEVLVLGSSHSYYGIDPEYFDKRAFNVAHISQSNDYDYEILKKYKEELKELKYVVIPVSYFSFYGSISSSTEAWRIRNYNLYYDINIDKSVSRYSELLSNSTMTNISRMYLYFFKNKKEIYCSELGFGVNYSSKIKKDLDTLGKTTAEEHTKTDFSFYERNNSYYKKTIEIVKEKNAKLIIFIPPAYKTYRDNLNDYQIETTIEGAKKLSEDNDVYFYDFLSDNDFDKNDFYDADHLNEIGAKKLTGKINKEISENLKLE